MRVKAIEPAAPRPRPPAAAIPWFEISFVLSARTVTSLRAVAVKFVPIAALTVFLVTVVTTPIPTPPAPAKAAAPPAPCVVTLSFANTEIDCVATSL